ncbi:MAG TPA: DUF6489 family protein [Solimonas sp.]|nr:DUF6489 family protein [Solimonas sp.]
MQIKIEIDVKPEELRRFLGLPDVSGLQEDIIAFLRDKVGAAGEVDLPGMVRSNLDALRNTAAWKNIAAKVRISEPADDDLPKGKARRRSRSAAGA